MITKYVHALEYLELLNQKAQLKKAKERARGNVSDKIAATEPKPLFSIKLPSNMVDLVFHEKKSKTVPESPKTTTRNGEKIARLASQKAMSGDHKDKLFSKRKSHKTVKIISNAIDSIQNENEHVIKRDLYTSSSEITSKPSSSCSATIEYFKVTANGHEHHLKRVDTVKVTVGVNGRPREDENEVKSESVQSKILEKRIPVSWEDQLLNFPEEVKTIKQKDSSDNEKPQNCCENYRILSQTPTSKLIWRQMTRPYSDSLSGLTNTQYINSSLEQPLPTSASFIKGTKLKNDLMHRYVMHGESAQQTLTKIKKQKIQRETSKTRGEKPKATKNVSVAMQICKLKSPSIFTLSADQLKTKEMEHVQDQILSKKTRLKRKDKIPILPLAHLKPFPRDPKVIEEYFHIKKMDTWQPYSSDEYRIRKPHESLENLAVHVNHQDSNNSAEFKNQSTSEKENNTASNAMHTDKLEIHAITLAKPPNFKGSEVKVTTREVQKKATTVKNPSVIHFKIPYCGYWNECEMPNGEEDHLVTESNNQEKLKSSAESSIRKKIPEGQHQKFHCERPKTR